jgi:hypothetical protein
LTYIDRNPSVRAVIAGSGITAEEMHSATSLVIDRFKELGPQLPVNHAWREGKLIHALAAKEEATRLGPELGMNDLETSVLEFMLTSHDIGRLTEGLRKEAGKTVAWGHGTDSVNELRMLFFTADETSHPRFGSQEFWRAVFVAIEHHADINPPSLEACGGDEAGFALYTIVSDLDKIGGFEKANKYVNDNDEKRRQIEVNWKEERKHDLTAGEEKGAIVPTSLLDVFESRQPLRRKDCQSYEAFMLQLMAWFFGVQNPEIYQHILATGGPQVLMSYFKRQLPDSEYARIVAVVKEFGVKG